MKAQVEIKLRSGKILKSNDDSENKIKNSNDLVENLTDKIADISQNTDNESEILEKKSINKT